MKRTSLISGEELKKYFELRERLFDFTQLFHYDKGDDRTIVIIGASFVDFVLEQVLRAFLPTNDPDVERLLMPDQPLGTFGARVKLLYSLGFLDKTVMEDLKLIGKIRNKFAHDLYASFDNDQIKSWCRGLKWHTFAILREPPVDATMRDYYQVGVNLIVSYLDGMVSMARSEKRRIRKDC